MRITMIGAVLAAAACGGMNPGNDAHGGGGGDAKLTTSEDVTCTKHVHIETSANGAVTERDTYWAQVDDVAPGDSFWIEQCDLTSAVANGGSGTSGLSGTFIDPPCSAGATCSTSGTPFPIGQSCVWTQSGTFVAGKLVVSCGGGISITSNGTTNSNASSYGTVRVHH